MQDTTLRNAEYLMKTLENLYTAMPELVKYPTVTVDVQIPRGDEVTLQIMFTNRDEVRAKVLDESFQVNTREYSRWEGRWNIFNSFNGRDMWRCENASLGTYAENATRSAQQKCRDLFNAAVMEMLEAHPELLKRAGFYNALNDAILHRKYLNDKMLQFQGKLEYARNLFHNLDSN